MEKTMRAVAFKQTGGPEILQIGERPIPEPRDGHIVINVKAFGLDRAETYFRSGKWPTPVNVIGIECVGEVAADPSGRFAEGQKVAAMMGGMGRTIDGFDPLSQMPSGIDFSFFGSFVFGTRTFRLTMCGCRRLSIAPRRATTRRSPRMSSALKRSSTRIARSRPNSLTVSWSSRSESAQKKRKPSGCICIGPAQSSETE
jgi:hypothetical protein